MLLRNARLGNTSTEVSKRTGYLSKARYSALLKAVRGPQKRSNSEERNLTQKHDPDVAHVLDVFRHLSASVC